jgi:hypothetical protein
MPTVSAPTAEALIPDILSRAPSGLVNLVHLALERTLAREETWLPWLVMWPEHNAYLWAPSARAAWGAVVGFRQHPSAERGGGQMWNVGKVIEEILDGMDWNGALKG